MEERLHNPYFIGARAWNGPIENWVGENKVYVNDMPRGGWRLLRAPPTAPRPEGRAVPRCS
jgi:hypothetical protein